MINPLTGLYVRINQPPPFTVRALHPFASPLWLGAFDREARRERRRRERREKEEEEEKEKKRRNIGK